MNEIHNLWYKGYVSDEEKHRLIITQWSDAKAEIEKLVRVTYGAETDVFSFIDS